MPELERRGGTVEKFIGDAVMAVFGAPVVHEDDPERAVRAALAILEALAEDGDVEVRIGITTGEALIALETRPEAGEGIASGDVVNTASRLQSAAPVGAILVDDTTYRASERAIEFAEAEPVVAKGKAEPIRVWQALRARTALGWERSGAAPLVGRSQELSLLRSTLARVLAEREPQLVTLVGVPGIGKSRLMAELASQEPAEQVRRLQGHSLPYGEGVTFWALGEMVKAHCAILESDTPEQARAEAERRGGGGAGRASEADSVERHLRPLAGLEAEDIGAGDRRSEAFAAWRRFIEAVAEQQPARARLRGPALGRRRPARLRRPPARLGRGCPAAGAGQRTPGAADAPLGLGRRQGQLVHHPALAAVAERDPDAAARRWTQGSLLDPAAERKLLDRAGGNPLYAEEFVRMLTERGDDAALPESIQGIVAARLDSLPPEEKELLQRAAVIGRVFWLGALGDERQSLEHALHALTRKEFVRRQRQGSMAGEAEYAFSHALVRDVAYEQIPRSRRSERHEAVAGWIESHGRTEDHAEMLAHHHLKALEYAQADGEQRLELARRAIGALQEAGDRALSLNAYPAAARYYEQALGLVPEGEDERTRCDLLLALGDADGRAGDTPSAQRSFLAAADLAEALGLAEQLAEAALGYGGRFIWEVSRGDRIGCGCSSRHSPRWATGTARCASGCSPGWPAVRCATRASRPSGAPP